MNRIITAAILTAALTACTSTETRAPELDLQESSARVDGTFTSDLGTVVFSAEQLEPQVFELTYQLNGMTLVQTADLEAGVILVDGFATDSGESTQITDADRALLSAMVLELDLLGDAVPRLITLARSIGSYFAEHPDSMEIQRVTYVDMARTVNCAAYNAYNWTSHDGSCGNFGDDRTTIENAYVSRHGDCGSADGTNFYKNGSWQCYEPDHDTSVEYAYGNCYGRCGAGCGGTAAWTWDCMDHDTCVRIGHALGSGWCSDELASTSDDNFSSSCQH
jgi:hypothetical protein